MIKKIVTLSIIVAACYACGSSQQSAEEKKDAPTKTVDLSGNPVYQKGLELIAKSDCLTCHKVEEAATGPAYRDVANKYPDNEATIDTLADKIIKGGSGNWGQVPMSAHPALAKEDAKQIVKYILLLKNK